jgi:hypothetical protein
VTGGEENPLERGEVTGKVAERRRLDRLRNKGKGGLSAIRTCQFPKDRLVVARQQRKTHDVENDPKRRKNVIVARYTAVVAACCSAERLLLGSASIRVAKITCGVFAMYVEQEVTAGGV